MTISAVSERQAPAVRRLSPGIRTLILQGGTVLDDRGGAIRANVRIEGDTIAAVESVSQARVVDSEVIDVTSRWIIPALVDAHVHLAAQARLARSLDASGQRDEALALLRTSLHYERMLLSGVATIRSLGGEPYEAATAIRQAMFDEFVVGPRVLTAGTAVVISRAQRHAERLIAAIKVARRNFGYLADVVMLGSCQVSARSPFTKRELTALVEEAHRRHVRIALRPITQTEAIAAAHAGIDSIEGLPPDADRKLISSLSRHSTALTPLLSSLARNPHRDELVLLASAEKVPVLAGSDWSPSRPGASLQRELTALRDAGLSATDVLASATSRAADALGLGASLGTVASGKLAELVVLRADPRKDSDVLGNPESVELIVAASDPLTS